MDLEQALARIAELEGQEEKAKGLESEKAALTKKRDELLSEIKTLKAKYAKFAEFADREDLDISVLLDIKEKFESGSSDLKQQYENAYKSDKAKFDARLKAIEDERAQEKQDRDREREAAKAAQLKADAIAELSKESYRIRNTEQFWRLFGEGKIQRDETGALFVGDDYKKTAIADYVQSVCEENDNAHHFKPKGGSGSGVSAGHSGGGTAVNPFKKGPTWNLTQQGRMIRENPEMAKRMKAEAGV